MATREQVCKQRQASAGHEPAGTRFLKKKKKKPFEKIKATLLK